MANLSKKLATNVAGDFFVDSTCIDCDTCRQIAPEVFFETDDEMSSVYHQPESESEIKNAVHALLACPTGSIGTQENKSLITDARYDFPLPVDDNVYYNGYTSRDSFGASSYFIQHAEGNWLVDSPKFLLPLVEKIKSMGGLKYIFLSHQDDVADAEKYAAEFGATRIIHKLELNAQPGAERVIEGEEPVEIAKDFLVIPTPGHTAGHCVLLYKNKFLFTGDHLWWRDEEDGMGASRTYNWYSWDRQKESFRKLLDYNFEWLLPGHGRRKHLPAKDMHSALQKLIDHVEGRSR